MIIMLCGHGKPFKPCISSGFFGMNGIGRRSSEKESATLLIEKQRKRSSTAMRNRTTLLRADQSRAWADCALFAPCGRGAPETEYYINDG